MPDLACALDPRFVPQQRFAGRLLALGVTGVSFVGMLIVQAAADDLSAWGRLAIGAAWLAAVAGLAWFAHIWPEREYAHTRYELDGDGLRIARGVYWRTIAHVPRSRIQHTDVAQGPLERRYGLGTLIVYTAGTTFARVTLAGLSYETALQLRDALRMERPDDSV